MFGEGEADALWYPLLSEVRRSSRGSYLLLSDGREIEAGISPDTLAAVLGKLGYPPLQELCRQGRAQVIDRAAGMSRSEWAAVSTALRSSLTAGSAFQGHLALLESLVLPYQEVIGLPLRLYGGINPAEYGARASLYLSPSVDFVPDVNRGSRWYYGLLDGARGWLFKTWIELTSGQVELESGEVPGHWVEDAEQSAAADRPRE